MYHIEVDYTSRLRTNIEIDDALLAEALPLSDFRTEKVVVEQGFQTLICLKRQQKILGLAGKVHWDGNIDDNRSDR
jgi:Arc/MetJ family transcription regulator